jgi:uncharacterized membrane protein YkvA (DUF1232 family)
VARGSRDDRVRTRRDHGRRDHGHRDDGHRDDVSLGRNHVSLGRPHVGVRRLLGWAALLPMASRAPMYGRLIWALLLDDRIPRGRKAVLAASLGYLALGRDVVPDTLPVIGGLDDLVVMVLAVDLFLDGVPPTVLDEKLGELGIDRRAFADDIARIRRFIPGSVRRLVRRIPGALTLAGDTLQHSRLGPRVRGWINKEGSIA